MKSTHKRLKSKATSDVHSESSAALPDVAIMVSRFLDVEAHVDDEELESSASGDESDSGASFIADDDIDIGQAPGLPRLRWDDLVNDQSIQALEAIAHHAEIRSRTRNAGELLVAANHLVLPEPNVEDSPLWRIRIKNGCERDVMVSILCKTRTSSAQKGGILSAFCRDAIAGYIYVESPSIADVTSVLAGIYGIARSKNGKNSISLVPLEERSSLLRFGGVPTITSGSWVRIKQHHLYRRDLALVHDVNWNSSVATVYVVPRIHMTRSHKRGRDKRQRPEPGLFDADAVRALYGENAVERRNQLWIFKNTYYKAGLAEIEVHLIELSDKAVNPTNQELEFFDGSHDPFVLKAVKYYQTALSVGIGDRIQVIAGPHRGLVGRLSDLHDDNTVTMEVQSQDILQPLRLQRWEISKSFNLGDNVRVIAGDFQGREGVVVDQDGPSATIYSTYRAASTLDPRAYRIWGEELTVALDKIQLSSSDQRIRQMWSTVGPSTHGGVEIMDAAAPSSGRRYERDPYAQMEVLIRTGDLKNHFACIIGTRTVDDKVLATLRTENRTINHMLEMNIDDLQERHTRLPLRKAQWVPRLSGPGPGPGGVYLPPSPSTPFHKQNEDVEPENPAWDPSSRTPDAISDDILPSRESAPPPPQKPEPGKWLLDSRLLHKRLDVRIKGTDTTLWHNARYEEECGFLELTKKVTSVKDSVCVKMGYNQSKVFFPLIHIFPETTTEKPRFVPRTAARPVIKTIGERVVIIGPDLEGQTNVIGHYAIVTYCPWPLRDDHACLQILDVTQTPLRYFSVESICRSNPM